MDGIDEFQRLGSIQRESVLVAGACLASLPLHLYLLAAFACKSLLVYLQLATRIPAQAILVITNFNPNAASFRSLFDGLSVFVAFLFSAYS